MRGKNKELRVYVCVCASPRILITIWHFEFNSVSFNKTIALHSIAISQLTRCFATLIVFKFFHLCDTYVMQFDSFLFNAFAIVRKNYTCDALWPAIFPIFSSLSLTHSRSLAENLYLFFYFSYHFISCTHSIQVRGPLAPPRVACRTFLYYMKLSANKKWHRILEGQKNGAHAHRPWMHLSSKNLLGIHKNDAGQTKENNATMWNIEIIQWL